MDLGWYGDLDLGAAVDHLAARDDVDGTRIGAVGLSMGGEEAIGLAAADDRVRAVVAEGATGRSSLDDAWMSDAYGARGAVTEWFGAGRDVVTRLLTDADRPTALRDAAAAAGQARFLLVTAGGEADEGHAADHVASAAPERVVTWEVPGAAHTAGLAVRPAEWAERVVGFLDDALGTRG